VSHQPQQEYIPEDEVLKTLRILFSLSVSSEPKYQLNSLCIPSASSVDFIVPVLPFCEYQSIGVYQAGATPETARLSFAAAR